jgi:threonyl-tRNA synthetase
VVGDSDVAASTLGVNPRGGDVERDVPLETFILRVRSEIDEQLASAHR